MATYLIGNIKGPKGADGVSPTARVEQTSTGATITITDATGTTSANIRNGVDSDGNNIDLTVYATKTEVAETYASKNYVDAAVEAVDAPVTSVNGMVGAVTITETDPTVPAWAKQPNKPAYTAQEVGALPASTVIPTVPTNISAFTNDAGYVDASALTTALAGKQDALIAGPNIDITNGVISASGGSSFSGDYDDLTNKPDLSIYAETADLATVATTGSYNDLTNKPTIPTVPTNVSDFTNDAGYITSSDLPADELPAITTGDAGKVLTVNSGENGVEWITPSSGGSSSGSGGVKYVDVSQGTSASSFNSNADLLTIGQALADGDDIPIIAIRNGNKTGELWYLINTRRATGDGGVTYTVYCDWYSPVENEIYYNRYNGSLQQWRDQTPSHAYSYYCKSPTGGSVGDVLAIRGIHSADGELFFEWKSIKGDSATNAASALYLKDANDAVYEITVGTDGILKATAVSNS